MCSIFSRILDGQVIVGRNFDWIQLGDNLHFVPPTRLYGLTTYGLFLIEQFGSDRPLEGMNSQGLFMGMTGIHADNFSPRKHNDYPIRLDEFGAMRFVLERAATTPQAVAILDQAEIVPHGVEPYVRLQYFIVDRHGEFCVIAGQEQTVLKRLDAIPFAAITNFPLSLRDNVVCDRFATLQRALPSVIHVKEVMALVETVSTELTVYSCLYSLTQQTVSVCVERDFQSILNFSLDQEMAQGYGFYNFGQLKLMSPDRKDRFKDAQYEVQRGFA
ncbi:hypothetical protein XM38_011130 [Halomicronema hongdechloris C2206]|uniref:Peptidase C45 hydrolase domain-containing protein n=1 Tax=Halomicronema hongdechloris C2206 TaxID=1641165 RepID=A0A1Z3HIS8_9CYAN|nr:carcinine hydrolase/isopenicillin-N N-acyltransferase family protein [Halomicronema hongdechloris]ASC70183.1 hypothetical protein XM38_011130 [Halomicronema hongdechloris C2206]